MTLLCSLLSGVLKAVKTLKTDFCLTPELTTGTIAVPWMHLVLGLCALFRYSAPITGMGILILYGAAVRGFGSYHMMDYLIFIGIG